MTDPFKNTNTAKLLVLLCLVGFSTALMADAIKPRLQALNLMSHDVVDPAGKKLATLEDLILDEEGKVKYVLLSYGGFLKMGEQRSLVPWHTLDIAQDSKKIVLDMTETQLLKAPKISKDGNDYLAGVNWSQIDDFYRKGEGAKGVEAETDISTRFRELDRNADQIINKEEAAHWPKLSNEFDVMDADKNQSLDEAEFARFEALRIDAKQEAHADDERSKRQNNGHPK